MFTENLMFLGLGNQSGVRHDPDFKKPTVWWRRLRRKPMTMVQCIKYYNKLGTPQSQDLCFILLYFHPAPSSLPGREQEREYLLTYAQKSRQARWSWGCGCGGGAKSARGGAERKGEASGSLKVVFELGFENWRTSRSGEARASVGDTGMGGPEE